MLGYYFQCLRICDTHDYYNDQQVDDIRWINRIKCVI